MAKRWTFEVTIFEGNDEFWESLEGKNGCDEITEIIEDSLSNGFYVRGETYPNGNCIVKLKEYKEEEYFDNY